MLNILALFGQRRPPQRRLKRGNGSWHERGLESPGPIPALRNEWVRPSPAAPRQRREQQQGYLAAHGLEKSYGGRKVVDGVSLYVRRGEAVGLLGPNGAGKTTAFYTITGLIKADSGQIELDGHDVTHLPMYQRARLGIGYLPQEASIFRGLNVEDNIRAVLSPVAAGTHLDLCCRASRCSRHQCLAIHEGLMADQARQQGCSRYHHSRPPTTIAHHRALYTVK